MFINQNITNDSGIRSGKVSEFNPHSVFSDFNHLGLEFYPGNTRLKSCYGFFTPVFVSRLYTWQIRTALTRTLCPKATFFASITSSTPLAKFPIQVSDFEYLFSIVNYTSTSSVPVLQIMHLQTHYWGFRRLRVCQTFLTNLSSPDIFPNRQKQNYCF